MTLKIDESRTVVSDLMKARTEKIGNVRGKRKWTGNGKNSSLVIINK
jgi:hypothetical protein